MAEKKKINWLLILQGWAMFWVVMGHSFLVPMDEGPNWVTILYKGAQPFRMPLFMLVSGWLTYLTRLKPRENGPDWSYFKILKEKVERLLLPGFAFSILAFAIKLALPDEVSRQVSLTIKDFFHAFLYPNDNPFRELWFIATLFWYFILTPLWKQVLKQDWSMWAIVAVLIVLHFIAPNIELLCIGRAFNYAIWYYLGLVICKTDMVERLFNRNPWITILVGIVIYSVGWLTNGIITTIGGIVFSFGIALVADLYIPKAFFSFRNYTYQIFLLGIFAQMAIKMAYRHMELPYLPIYIICTIVGLYVPVIVAKIVEKINWKPLSMCYGLKKK